MLFLLWLFSGAVLWWLGPHFVCSKSVHVYVRVYMHVYMHEHTANVKQTLADSLHCCAENEGDMNTNNFDLKLLKKSSL